MMRQGVISAVIFLLLAMLVMIYMPEGYAAISWAIGAVVVVTLILIRARKGGD
ncbi:TPA: hypothetical protein NQC75_005468 [Klebsiella variicola]|nr:MULTISPECIES: hypothetical protein [Enterobacteriaceae]BBC21675.1 hypothetical protein [Klebsiella aerogenes]BEN91317.1 hypothetical protein SMQC07_51160 [Serratia marcescens]HBR1180756.1 hypothetical protein [Klebsiella quasipneumoniae subsp. similipneumoniae]HCI8641563.1 hypothetical protein [Enterobacter hormaechei subsp. xiangfangensis]HCI8647289.1 hypothetical protein [Klebsiella variicola]HCR1008100.1 hypothetical protein [Enterobacter roggenkampii]HDS5007643.1 hypothetical protein 